MPAQIEPESRPARCILAGLFSGLFLWLAMEPQGISLAAWIGLAFWLQALLSARGRVPLLSGFLHGVCFFGLSVPWVYTVMRQHGNLGPWPAAGVYLLLVVYLSLYPAVFGVCVAVIARRSRMFALCAAPFVWVALEYARTHAPELGFPWNLLGYAVAKQLGLLQVSSVTGIYGVSFALAAWNSLGAWLLGMQHRWRAAIFFAAAILGSFAAGQTGRLLPASPARYAAHLVQPNFPELPSYPQNWLDQQAANLDELERISIEGVKQGNSPSRLIIWPEVPAPFYFLDPRFSRRAERVARESGAHFLLGVVEWKPGADQKLQPYNSAVMLGPGGQRTFAYDKIHLVPFGEYVPWRNLLTFAGHLVAEVGDYKPGTAFALGELPDVPGPAETRTPGPAKKFGTFICFEAVFPNLVRQFTNGGAELLINISNDGWYGRSAAPEQHLAMARVRAVENRRWLLRATNNGHTVVIDPYGREVAQLAPDLRGVLQAPYDFRSDRTLYSRWGDWWAWMCGVVSLVLVAMAIKKQPSKRMAKQK